MKHLIILVLALCCAGCLSLPEGEPPAGAIVSQQKAEKLSLKAAGERLITSLTMFTMTEMPGQPVAIDAPEASEEVIAMMKNVLQNVSAISGIRMEGRTARYTFKAVRRTEDGWLFTILDNMHGRSVIWQDSFQIGK